MRIILRIFLFPIIVALTIIVLFLGFILDVSTKILNLFSMLFMLVFFVSIYSKSVSGSVIGITLGFAFSPYGLPVLGGIIVEFLAEIVGYLKTI